MLVPKMMHVKRWLAISGTATLLFAVAVFVSLTNANVEGTNDRLTQLAAILALISFPISVVAWVLTLWRTRKVVISLVICVGSFFLCFITSVGFGLSSDLFLEGAKRPSVDEFVLDLAFYGTGSCVLLVLFLASLIDVVHQAWSMWRARRRH